MSPAYPPPATEPADDDAAPTEQQAAACPGACPAAAQHDAAARGEYRELLAFALPMLATLAADPVASLVDTAYIGHLGAVPLAGVGLALSIFNSLTRLMSAPLLAVATSRVASAAAAAEVEAATSAVPGSSEGDDEAADSMEAGGWDAVGAGGSGAEGAAALQQPLLAANQAQQAPPAAGPLAEDLQDAVASALVLALCFGMLEAAVLLGGAPLAATLWGAPPGSSLRAPALQFLVIRAAGAPITVCIQVLQGVLRGLKDVHSPLLATLVSTLLSAALGPVLIFWLRLGVRGSAAATLAAEAVPTVGMLWWLRRRHRIRLLAVHRLQWRTLLELFGPTGYVVLRTLSLSSVLAVGTSLAARAGPIAAAAHQVAGQLWLAASLLADSLAMSVQILLARAAAAADAAHVRAIVRAGLVLGAALGALLTACLAAGSGVLPRLFTRDADVLSLVGRLMPLVYGTQLLNTGAFVWDGVLYGAGGYKYAAAMMPICATPALGAMFGGAAWLQGDALATLVAVWVGLGSLMGARILAICVPYQLRWWPFDSLLSEPAALRAPLLADAGVPEPGLAADAKPREGDAAASPTAGGCPGGGFSPRLPSGDDLLADISDGAAAGPNAGS